MKTLKDYMLNESLTDDLEWIISHNIGDRMVLLDPANTNEVKKFITNCRAGGEVHKLLDLHTPTPEELKAFQETNPNSNQLFAVGEYIGSQKMTPDKMHQVDNRIGGRFNDKICMSFEDCEGRTNPSLWIYLCKAKPTPPRKNW